MTSWSPYALASGTVPIDFATPASANEILDGLLAAWGGEVVRRPPSNSEAARFALLHPAIGVALLDVAPDNRPEAALRFRERFRALLPPGAATADPPIVYAAVSVEELWHLKDLLDSAFAGLPPLDDTDESWLPIARAALSGEPVPHRPPPPILHSEPDFAPRLSHPAPSRFGWIAAGLILPLLAGASLLAGKGLLDRLSPPAGAEEGLGRRTPADAAGSLASLAPRPAFGTPAPRGEETAEWPPLIGAPDWPDPAPDLANDAPSFARQDPAPAPPAGTDEPVPSPREAGAADEAPRPTLARWEVALPVIPPPAAEAERAEDRGPGWFAPVVLHGSEPEVPAFSGLGEPAAPGAVERGPDAGAARPQLPPDALAAKAKAAARAAAARAGAAGSQPIAPAPPEDQASVVPPEPAAAAPAVAVIPEEIVTEQPAPPVGPTVADMPVPALPVPEPAAPAPAPAAIAEAAATEEPAPPSEPAVAAVPASAPPVQQPAAPAPGPAVITEPAVTEEPVPPSGPAVAAVPVPAPPVPGASVAESPVPGEEAAPRATEAATSPPPATPPPPLEVATTRAPEPLGARGIAAPAPVARPSPPPAVQPEILAGLVRRGDAMLAIGDVSAARLLYERAAAGGSGAAAMALGRTYDAAVLASLGVRGLRADPAAAAAWYRRAEELGVRDARTARE